MADVFISYKSERRPAAAHLAKVLELHGYSVWFDYGLVTGRDFGRQIEKELRAAKAAVVLWCGRSVNSEWVLEEAHLAKALDLLIPAWIERVDPPLGFGRADTIDLTAWDGAPRTSALDRLLGEIGKRVGREPNLSFSAAREYEETWRRFGAPSLLKFGLIDPIDARESARGVDVSQRGVTQQSTPSAPPPAPPASQRKPQLRVRHTLAGHEGAVTHASFSPDGARVATAGWDGTARLWDARTGASLAVMGGHDNRVTVAEFSHGGQWLATTDYSGTICLRDGKTGEIVRTMTGHRDAVSCIAFEENDAALLSGGGNGEAFLFEISSGKAIAALKGHRADVRGVAINPKTPVAATACLDATIKLWGERGRELATLSGHKGFVHCCAFSPDGEMLASGGQDMQVRLWDGDGKPLRALAGHAGQIYGVLFSADGARLLSRSEDGSARLWSVASGQALAILQHTKFVSCASFSPDGARILTASWDGNLGLWSASNGALLQKFAVHGDSIHMARFSPDGRAIVTGSTDGTAKIFDIEEA